MRRFLLLASLLAAGPAVAAERTVSIGTVTRLRVEGPFEVTVRTGVSPGLVITGERRAIEAVDARTDGEVLALRPGSGERSPFATVGGEGPVTITVATPALRGVVVIGGAAVSVGAMKGETVDLSVSGAGTLSVASVEAQRAAATLIGNGGMTIGGGHASFARLVGNGGGAIDAGALVAGELIVHLDGPGSVKAAARYTAQVIDTGLGSVAVAGTPKCTIRSAAGGPVSCGSGL